MVNANTFLVDFGPGISDVVFPVLRNEALRYKSHVSLTSTQLSRGNSATNYFVPVVSETIRDSPTKITPAQLADIATTPSETPSAPETPSGTSSLPAVEANLESKDWSSQFTPTEAIDAPPTTIRDSPTPPSETHRAPKTPGDTSSLPAVEDAQAAKLQAEDWSPEELRRMHEVETVTAGARDQNLKRFFESQDSVDVFDNPPEPQIMPRIPLKQPQEKQIEVSNFPSLSRNAGNVDFDTQRRLHIERDRQQNVAFHQEYSAALWKSQAQVMRREKAEEDRLSRMLQRQQQERSQFDLSGFDFPSLGEAASQPRRVTTCISKPVTQFPSLKARPVGDCVSDDEFEGWLTPVCATEPPLKEWMQERWEGGNTSDALTLLFNLDFPIPWVEARELSLPLLKILAATCLDAVREAKEKQNATKSFTFQRRLDDAGVQKADLVEIAKWLVKTRISLERAPNFNEYECARALDDLYQKLYAKKGKRGNKKRKNLSLYPNT
ncbi:MAG: hypothetical protein KVP17_004393 [Porospora cf. gigantea B]|uniref:uncharacterized protein n=1 Tax=Porospora cf. gigantea B TaxID=2853592 RepID=UPI003571E7DE|nr:MAG: hypothetical protein KVP17_004393 [Porospora cf. gigantea B]